MSKIHRLPLALLLIAACGGGSKDGTTTTPSGGGGGDQAAGDAPGGAVVQAELPAIPSSPAPMPDALLATVSIGDPRGQLDAVGAYVDAVQPGFGAMISTNFVAGISGVVGAPGLAGYDLSKPLYVVVLDPKRGGGELVLVVAVADERALASSVGGPAMVQIHGGYAAIGKGASLVAAAPYALSNLAKTTPPKHVHAVVHMNRVMDSYGQVLQGQLRQSMGSSQNPAEVKAAEGMFRVLAAVERLELSLEADPQNATASVVVYPLQGSGLAQWGSSQQASDFSVASRLPKGPWLMVAAGRIDWGAMKAFWSELAAAQGNAAVAEWFGVFGHEVALAVWAKEKQIKVAGMVAVTDSKKLDGLMKDYVVKTAAAPKSMDSMQVVAKANAHKAGGASLHSITVQPGASASADDKKEWETIYGKGGLKSYFGLAGNWLVFALDKDKDAKGLTGKVVAGAKAKAPKASLDKVFETAISEAKTRKESGVMVFDLTTIAPDPVGAKGATVSLGLGFEGPVLKSRVTLPVATGKLIVQGILMRGMGGGSP